MSFGSRTRSRVRRIWDRRALLSILVRRDLRIRYARSVLGYLWTVIDPLSMSLIYFVIFTQVFTRKDVGHSPYMLFLLTGMLPWQWFNASVNESARSLLAEAKLVRSTNLPRELWVVRVVLAKGIEFLYSLPILAVFVIVYLVLGQAHLNWRLVLFPVGLVLQTVLQIGLGLLLAPLTVIADDTIRLVRILLRVLFYVTPIIYSLDHLPRWLQTLLYINPMSGILEFYRAGFFPQDLHWTAIGIGSAVTAFFVLLGIYVFARMERAVLKEI